MVILLQLLESENFSTVVILGIYVGSRVCIMFFAERTCFLLPSNTAEKLVEINTGSMVSQGEVSLTHLPHYERSHR